MDKFYLTTAIPYVNARPHLGHALEYIQADMVHRYHELVGDEVFFVSGADENALKNVQAAEKAGMEPNQFLDKYSRIFAEFYRQLEVNLNEFRRGTDREKHWPGAQKLWQLVEKNGDLYKKKYRGLYCVGCEAFKTEKDLVDGKCPDHDRVPEEIEEENYFFKLSRYQDKLVQLIESGELRIYPDKRKGEILAFVKQGLIDFSASRSNERARGIGVPVPGDEKQKQYVWFDALGIYLTAIGWGYDEEKFKKWWPADLHVIGKDIIRFHAVYWPAMLLSAGLLLPKAILVHGFVTSGGRKMSKTIGNVIDPYEVMDKYGIEPLRYYLLSQIPTQDDGDFTYERFEEVYQSDLANGLGNLVARVGALAEQSDLRVEGGEKKIGADVAKKIKDYEFDQALRLIWGEIAEADKLINEKEVWKLKGEVREKILEDLVERVRQIGTDLQPFLPQTAEKILAQFGGPKIKRGENLFNRLS